MFNLGNDDKEKLKENMEEIKNLVNNESQEDETTEDNQSQGGPDFSKMNREAAEDSNIAPNEQNFQSSFNGENTEETSSSQSSAESQPPQQNSLSRNQRGEQGQENPVTEGQQLQDRSTRDQASGPQKSQGSNRFSRSQQNNQQQVEQSQRPNQENMSDTSDRTETGRKNAQTAQSADFSKGQESSETIFLTVEHFEEVQDRVEEMRYLSNEIKDVMEHLEAGISEDQRTEEEAQQLLNDFGTRREEVEDIVSSNKQ
ncbi:MAG: hypothetical protein ABEK00_02455 [Candidatus Nanohaloarchaea archaeon]